MRETIVEYPEMTLYFHPEHGIVHHENRKAAHGPAFRDVLTRGVELLRTRGACKWLSDDRHYYVLPPDDDKWGSEVWFPMALAAGWKYWAVVRPHKAVAELNVSRFVKTFGDLGITARMVSDFHEAWDWLVSVER